uniref:Acyl-CoA binding domain containing 5a n=1 Tax=Xiphophorus couchianus TaxID=32473 RepID=A0A3B5M7E0_9TELE
MEVESVSAEEQKGLTQKRFGAAVKVIKSLPPNGPFQPSNDMMLKFYSYYKQATIGPCNIPRPGFWDVVGKAKWDAWNSLGEMSEEEAMAAYVDQMKLILEGMPMTDEVEELLRVLGPFYELIDEKKKITQISDLSTGAFFFFSWSQKRNLTVYNLPLICSARLTKFARQLEGKYATIVAKSIIRNMEKNGTLETRPARLGPNEEVEQEEEEEEEDEEEEEKGDTMEIRKGNTDVYTRTSQVTSDSDSEVYCDSVDQFGQEEASPNTRTGLWVRLPGVLTEGFCLLQNSEQNRSLDELEEEDSHFQEEDQDPPQAARRRGEETETGGAASLSLSLTTTVFCFQGYRSLGPGSQLHCSGDGTEPTGPVPPRASLDEQIVVALARVQEDIQSVLERMRTVEALTANLNPSWWPFDISPTSLAFAVIWPFVVQWLIRLYFQKRRR